MEHESHELKKMFFSSSRLEALTDGIFAFAMTLLVLNLNVPELHGAVTNDELIGKLLSLQHRFLIFLLSFLLLASTWGVHHRQFSVIKKSDTAFMWINMLRLLFVVIVPFSSVLIGEYGSLPAAAVFFNGNILLLTSVTYYQWRYAVSHHFTEGLDDDHAKAADVKNMYAIIICLFATIAAFFVPESSYWIFALLFPGIFILKKLGKTI